VQRLRTWLPRLQPEAERGREVSADKWQWIALTLIGVSNLLLWLHFTALAKVNGLYDKRKDR